MKIRLIGASVAIGLAGLGAALAPAAAFAATTTVTPAAASSATCTDHWPASVQGLPSGLHGAAAGAYIGHVSNGWALRVTHPGDANVVFSGRIVSSAPLDANPVKLEGNDWFAVSADHKVITFRFTNYGGVDGINFATSCAQHLTFSFDVDGHAVTPDHIWIGHDSNNPLENPFTVNRLD
jgi:hypothetical protein